MPMGWVGMIGKSVYRPAFRTRLFFPTVGDRSRLRLWCMTVPGTVAYSNADVVYCLRRQDNAKKFWLGLAVRSKLGIYNAVHVKVPK
jgi:hypothetical protein